MTLTDFQCTVCGFIIQQNARTRESERFASFDTLPTTWCCLKCGVLKSLFKEIEHDPQAVVDDPQTTESVILKKVKKAR
jgi:rubredoxin